MNKPNAILMIADPWRAQAAGYAGDSNARTPCLDALAAESLDFTHAPDSCPVCPP